MKPSTQITSLTFNPPPRKFTLLCESYCRLILFLSFTQLFNSQLPHRNTYIFVFIITIPLFVLAYLTTNSLRSSVTLASLSSRPQRHSSTHQKIPSVPSPPQPESSPAPYSIPNNSTCTQIPTFPYPSSTVGIL